MPASGQKLPVCRPRSARIAPLQGFGPYREHEQQQKFGSENRLPDSKPGNGSLAFSPAYSTTTEVGVVAVSALLHPSRLYRLRYEFLAGEPGPVHARLMRRDKKKAVQPSAGANLVPVDDVFKLFLLLTTTDASVSHTELLVGPNLVPNSSYSAPNAQLAFILATTFLAKAQKRVCRKASSQTLQRI